MMKRRDSIKTMILGSIGASMTLKSCITSEDKIVLDQVWKYSYGRTQDELKWDNKVLTGKFFSDTELLTIEKIAKDLFQMASLFDDFKLVRISII